jgi:hypothetical protein
MTQLSQLWHRKNISLVTVNVTVLTIFPLTWSCVCDKTQESVPTSEFTEFLLFVTTNSYTTFTALLQQCAMSSCTCCLVVASNKGEIPALVPCSPAPVIIYHIILIFYSISWNQCYNLHNSILTDNSMFCWAFSPASQTIKILFSSLANISWVYLVPVLPSECKCNYILWHAT